MAKLNTGLPPLTGPLNWLWLIGATIGICFGALAVVMVLPDVVGAAITSGLVGVYVLAAWAGYKVRSGHVGAWRTLVVLALVQIPVLTTTEATAHAPVEFNFCVLASVRLVVDLGAGWFGLALGAASKAGFGGSGSQGFGVDVVGLAWLIALLSYVARDGQPRPPLGPKDRLPIR